MVLRREGDELGWLGFGSFSVRNDELEGGGFLANAWLSETGPSGSSSEGGATLRSRPVVSQWCSEPAAPDANSRRTGVDFE
jgi:hypothetical protein